MIRDLPENVCYCYKQSSFPCQSAIFVNGCIYQASCQEAPIYTAVSLPVELVSSFIEELGSDKIPGRFCPFQTTFGCLDL